MTSSVAQTVVDERRALVKVDEDGVGARDAKVWRISEEKSVMHR